MGVDSLQQLDIADDKKKYIIDKLNPVLEDLVTQVVMHLPKEPAKYMLEWCCTKSGSTEHNVPKEVAENRALKAELDDLRAKMRNMAVVDAQLKGPQEKEAESEEEDDDDELDEIPPAPTKTVGARQSVSAEAYGAWNQKKAFTPPVIEKTDAQKEKLRGVLETSFMFRALEKKDMNVIIDAMAEVKASKGTRVIEQGENGNYLFIIESGSFECKIKIEDVEKVVKTCEAGDVFGELALLYNCPRAAHVDAAEDSVTWKLDRDTFTAIVADGASKRRTKYCEFLKKVSLLETMDDYERSQIADALKPETAKAGDEIIKQGDAGNMFYIIEEGSAVAIKDGKEVMTYAQGSFFGELALLTSDARAATVQAQSECSLLTLDRKTFTRMLGSLEGILTRQKEAYK
jgi:cAMP-dependent protein kinase regulator